MGAGVEEGGRGADKDLLGSYFYYGPPKTLTAKEKRNNNNSSSNSNNIANFDNYNNDKSYDWNCILLIPAFVSKLFIIE